MNRKQKFTFIMIVIPLISILGIFIYIEKTLINHVLNWPPYSQDQLGESKNISTNIGCLDKRLHHMACPNGLHYTKLQPEDGGILISNFYNNQGIRTSEIDPTLRKNIDFSIVKNFFVGDSYLEADEVPFNDTISSVFKELSGENSLQVGYSSWAPIQYVRVFEGKNLSANSNIYMFLYINDFFPSGNLLYHSMLNDSNSNFKFPDAYYFRTHSKIYQLWHRFTYTPEIVPEELHRIYLTSASTSCENINSYKNKYHPELFQYIVFNFKSICWPDDFKSSVDSVIKDIKKFEIELKQNNINLHVFQIPHPFSFSDETSIGRAFPPLNLHEDSEIYYSGLTKYLENELGSNLYTDLYQFITDVKNETLVQLYLPIDGHWNSTAHRLIAQYIFENYN